MKGPFGGVKGPLKMDGPSFKPSHTKIMCARLAAVGQPQKGAAARRSSPISHWPSRPCVSEGATGRKSGMAAGGGGALNVTIAPAALHTIDAGLAAQTSHLGADI